MNAIVEGEIGGFLVNTLHVAHYDVGTVLECMREVAGAGGFELDERFAVAGLGGGPEARVASRIVNYALGLGGTETPEDAIRAQIRAWIRSRPQKGMR
jgi:hypothetical protein